MLTFGTEDIARWGGEFFWPFLRILALISAAPGFNSPLIPQRVKAALAMAIAVVIGSTLPQTHPLDLSWTSATLAAEQVLVGLAIGYSMQLVLTSLAVAGEFIGVQMGFGIASLFDPQTGFDVPVISNFFSLTGLILFLALNGHLVMLAVLMKSFELVPIAAGNGITSGGWHALAAAGTALFQMGLWLALPVIAVLLAAHMAVAILSRVAPQFNVISIGFSIFLLVGLTASVALVPFLLPVVTRIIETGSQVAMRVLGQVPP